MATIPFDQIQQIIKLNPNKQLIGEARDKANKLMLHVFGDGLQDAMNRNDYFESTDIFAERKKGAISNKDLFARLLQREEMVFTAQGGASFYEGLSPVQTIEFDALLDNIRYNMNIRKWVKEFGLNAYRTDPMSVLFVELSKDGKRAYPTYKSISCIYDYQTTGRKIEYICFSLTVADCLSFGVVDGKLSDMPPSNTTNYFRFVDDTFDYILKNEDGTVTAYNTLVNVFKYVPAIITSDLINFTNPKKFSSPLDYTIELADSYCTDRSIRNLSKKYTGFPKTIEPILKCQRCDGIGYVAGSACPECTPAGWDKGTGVKNRTTVSDKASFPIDVDSGFDYKKYFAYITPDIATWDKQDTSLNDLENQLTDVYWGTNSTQTTTGPNFTDKSIQETATKTLENLQPIYNRLNLTADWVQSTENAIVDFIGTWKYGDTFKGSNRTLGRYYILETPNDLLVEYLDAKTKGSPLATLTDILSKYYHSLYSENKIKLSVALKLMNVEPFVHYTLVQVQAANPAKIDLVCKIYFSEWLATLEPAYLIVTPQDKMVADLVVYGSAKELLIPELLVEPAVSITEAVRNTQ